MPHDKNGNVLKEGDRVDVPCIVKSITPGDEYCNVNLETLVPMPPYTVPSTIVLNTKQVEKVEGEIGG